MDAALITRLRAHTPGCGAGAHFNHAGASLPSSATLWAITEQLRREALDGPMEAASHANDGIAAARAAAAALLNAAASEVAFASSGAAAWGMAFAALPALAPGDRVLVGRHEWGGNLATLEVAANRAGARVEVIPCRDDGAVDPDALATMMDTRVKLVSLTWLPANGGLINDAVAIGRVARAADVAYFVDAGQALGQLPVDVQAIGCDVLNGAGRKHLRGPRGTAILYVRQGFHARLRPAFLDVLSAPWIDDAPVPRGDARVFETSEVSAALLLGLGQALGEALANDVPAIRDRVRAQAERLRARLAALPGVTIHDLGTEQSGLVSFTIEGIEAARVRDQLAVLRLAVGANPRAYTPLDMTARRLAEVVRASVSYLNTDDEVDRLVTASGELARSRR